MINQHICSDSLIEEGTAWFTHVADLRPVGLCYVIFGNELEKLIRGLHFCQVTTYLFIHSFVLFITS